MRDAFRVISLLRKICNHPSLVNEGDVRQNQRRNQLHPSGDDLPQNSMEYGAVRQSGKLVVLDRIVPVWHKAGCIATATTAGL